MVPMEGKYESNSSELLRAVIRQGLSTYPGLLLRHSEVKYTGSDPRSKARMQHRLAFRKPRGTEGRDEGYLTAK